MSTHIAFLANPSAEAQRARAELIARYGEVAPQHASVLVALGGDGFMLRTLHAMLDLRVPVFGMKLGKVGFLMNHYRAEDLPARLARAHATPLAPLHMRVQTRDGGSEEALAFNEVSLLRQTNQAAHLQIALNDRVKLDELICDGALVATPAGSTAYNLSAHGPILPLDANVLALTPISPFRPRRWRGALLPVNTQVRIEVREPELRPVSATADFHEVRDIRSVVVRSQSEHAVTLLFDPEHKLAERILDEQFAL
ncbi:MAG: NAD kinase [Metallibacterium sp.]